jgi:hypothetical protein
MTLGFYHILPVLADIYGGWYFHEYKKDGCKRLDILQVCMVRGRQSRIRDRVG